MGNVHRRAAFKIHLCHRKGPGNRLTGNSHLNRRAPRSVRGFGCLSPPNRRAHLSASNPQWDSRRASAALGCVCVEVGRQPRGLRNQQANIPGGRVHVGTRLRARSFAKIPTNPAGGREDGWRRLLSLGWGSDQPTRRGTSTG